MSTSSKEYRFTIEVRGYELDSSGHVNHSVYLNYMEYARWKMLESEGITLELMKSRGLFPIIAQLEIQYLKPAFMGEQLEVRSRLIEKNRVSYEIEQTIYRKDTPIAKAKLKGAMIDEAGRPARVIPEMERL